MSPARIQDGGIAFALSYSVTEELVTGIKSRASKQKVSIRLADSHLRSASARCPGRDFSTGWQPTSYERIALLGAVLDTVYSDHFLPCSDLLLR